MRDRRRTARLSKLVVRLQEATDPLDQAHIAVEIREVAEGIMADCTREANEAGRTWREIGATLGIPFQTLYRRYGST